MGFLWMSFGIPMVPNGFPWLFVVFSDFHDSSMLSLKLSHFPMMVLWLSYDLHDFSTVPYDLYGFVSGLLCFPLNTIWFGCDFLMVFLLRFLSFLMLFLWSSFGSPMIFILWFCSVFRWNSYNILPWFSYGFPKCSQRIPMVCQRPRGPQWLTEALQRLTERPIGSPWLTEALRRLTEAWRIRAGAGDNGVGGGGPRSGGSWACAGAGILVCRCAGVQVGRWSRWCTNIPVCNASVDCAMISFQLSYVFATIVLWFSPALLVFVFSFLQVFQMVLV